MNDGRLYELGKWLLPDVHIYATTDKLQVFFQARHIHIYTTFGNCSVACLNENEFSDTIWITGRRNYAN